MAGYWEPSPPPQVGWETSWGSSWPRVGASERRFKLSTGCPGAGTAISGDVRGEAPGQAGLPADSVCSARGLRAGASPSRKIVLCGALGRRGGPASLSRAAGALGDRACHPGAGREPACREQGLAAGGSGRKGATLPAGEATPLVRSSVAPASFLSQVCTDCLPVAPTASALAIG